MTCHRAPTAVPIPAWSPPHLRWLASTLLEQTECRLPSPCKETGSGAVPWAGRQMSVCCVSALALSQKNGFSEVRETCWLNTSLVSTAVVFTSVPTGTKHPHYSACEQPGPSTHPRPTSMWPEPWALGGQGCPCQACWPASWSLGPVTGGPAMALRLSQHMGVCKGCSGGTIAWRKDLRRKGRLHGTSRRGPFLPFKGNILCRA